MFKLASGFSSKAFQAADGGKQTVSMCSSICLPVSLSVLCTAVQMLLTSGIASGQMMHVAFCFSSGAALLLELEASLTSQTVPCQPIASSCVSCSSCLQALAARELQFAHDRKQKSQNVLLCLPACQSVCPAHCFACVVDSWTYL